MIRQSDFISKKMFENALEVVKARKNKLYLTEISFETICDGRCIQVLHKGSFDDELASFGCMDVYCKEMV